MTLQIGNDSTYNRYSMTDDRRDRGQVLLITMLVLAIATTIALSLISRTTTDLAISNQIEESARAFSAAEAGIEEALKTGQPATRTLGSDESFTATVNTVGGSAGVFSFSQKSERGLTDTLWLVNHNADGTLNLTPTYTAPDLTLCWTGGSPTPALEVLVPYITAGNYRVARYTFDPDSGRTSSNKFTSVGGAGSYCGQASVYRGIITFAPTINPAADTILAVRIRPLYSDTQLYVDTGATVLPQQGRMIESTGATLTTQRKIVVYQDYRTTGSEFDAVIVSQSSFGH